MARLPRPNRLRPPGAQLEALESRRLLDGSWDTYAGNPQHTALSSVPSQALDRIAWQTPVNLDPQYSGGDLTIHYGSPLVTAADTIIVPVKTGASGGFKLLGFSGADGTAEWTLSTDYILPPHDWTPSYSPALTPDGRLYFAGPGGTVYYANAPDSPGATTSGQLSFYDISNYTHAGFDGSVYISTPITSDSSGDIFFGFQVTGSNPLNLKSGIARIGADGIGTWVSATAASGDSGLIEVPQGCAPALSANGKTLYITVSSGDSGRGDLLALDGTTLATLGKVALKDPATGNNAVISDDSSASPTVGPDGDVYYGVLENPFASNHDRGWLLHFSGDLTRTRIPGAFGWDDTASIVPASMVPSYKGTSSYLLMTKYNNYAPYGGGGLNELAVLDPNATTIDPATGTSVMREVLTILGPTPDPEYDQTYPGAVREWCINTAAVDPATDSILANSEDGTLYRWDLASNSFSQKIVLTSGLGEAYTPTVIGADGSIYAMSDATLYQIKATSSPTPTPTPTPPPNQAPVLQPIANQTVDEGAQLDVQAMASDPDGDSITFSLGSGAPPGSSINANTGLFNWRPDPYSSTGSYSVTVTASDNGSPPLGDSQTFTIDVLAVNHPPRLNPIPSQLAEQGQPIEVLLSRYASDPDRPPQTLTYSVTGAPSGASFDPASGLFAWTVPPDQALGPYPIGATVTDDGSPPMSTSGTFTIDVVSYTPPPVLRPIPDQTVDEGVPLTVQATATDADATLTITYSLGPGAPAGATIDPKTGVFTWTPDPYSSTGNYAVTAVAVADGPVVKSDSATFGIAVLAVNHPPVVTAAIPVQVVASGRVLQLFLAGYASDPDRPAQALTYSLAPGDPAGASIDPASGLLTWNTSPGQHIGAYSFGVIVTDNGSPPLSARTSLVVDVVDSGPAATVRRARVSVKHGLTIALRFSQPMDPATAADPADYILVPAKKSKTGAPATEIPLAVSYNPATDTVTLVAQRKVRRGQALRLTVIGSGPDGLSKVTGLPLAGDRVHAVTNYVATIKGASIRQTNAAPGGTRSKAASNEALGRYVRAASQARRMASMAHAASPATLASRALERR